MQLSSLSLGPYPEPELCLVLLIYTDLPFSVRKENWRYKIPNAACFTGFYRFLSKEPAATSSGAGVGPCWVSRVFCSSRCRCQALSYGHSPNPVQWDAVVHGYLTYHAQMKVNHLFFFCSKSEQSTVAESPWLLWLLWPNIKFYCTL